MECVNHGGKTSVAFCQNCGSPVCPECIRGAQGRQVLCPACWTTRQATQQVPFNPAAQQMPNPGAAAVLGIIPGVGAMYNGQFIKGLIHVMIFAILISLADHYSIFGIFIAAWIVYQSFEAYHTAVARRNGQPLPDPLGLNEIGVWVNGNRVYPPAGNGQPQTPPQSGFGEPPQGAQTGSGDWQNPYQGAAGAYQTGANQAPQNQAAQNQAAQNQAGPVPPWTPGQGMPPMPPRNWCGREPIGAFVLIALGVLFLLGQLDIFSWHIFEYTWPLLLIALGVWLLIRRMQETQGGQK